MARGQIPVDAAAQDRYDSRLDLRCQGGEWWVTWILLGVRQARPGHTANKPRHLPALVSDNRRQVDSLQRTNLGRGVLHQRVMQQKISEVRSW